jgi:hypothetical protein
LKDLGAGAFAINFTNLRDLGAGAFADILAGFWTILFLRAIKYFGGFQIKLWPSIALY